MGTHAFSVSAIESELKSTSPPASFERLKVAITKATPEDHAGDVVDHLLSSTKESGQAALEGEMVRACASSTAMVRLRIFCSIIPKLGSSACFHKALNLAMVVLHSGLIAANQKVVVGSRT